MVFVNIVEYDEYADYIKKAESSMSNKGSKDFHYLACALAVNADFIWSDDKDFSCQKLVAVKTTNNLIEENKI